MTERITSANTRRAIKDALLDTLRRKPFDTIFVTEICRAVGISRGTFYIHYKSLDAVIEDILDDVFDHTKAMPSQLCLYRWATHEDGMPLCMFIRGNRKYAVLLQDPSLRARLIDRLMDKTLEGLLDGIEGHTDLTREQLEGFYTFQLNGCLATITKYLDASDEEWKHIQKTVDGVMRDGMDRRVYRAGKSPGPGGNAGTRAGV